MISTGWKAALASACAAATLAGCTSKMAREAGPNEVVVSSKPEAEFSRCIQEEWSQIEFTVTANPYQGGTNVRVTNEAGVLVQADIKPVPTGGSVATLTTPYFMQVRNFLPSMKTCAG